MLAVDRHEVRPGGGEPRHVGIGQVRETALECDSERSPPVGPTATLQVEDVEGITRTRHHGDGGIHLPQREDVEVYDVEGVGVDGGEPQRLGEHEPGPSHRQFAGA
jgi:hypothetical protein